jgi:hypothetical protein
MPDVPNLLPASSWGHYNLRRPKLPPHIEHAATDSGRFVATFRNKGVQTYTPAQYTRWPQNGWQ